MRLRTVNSDVFAGIKRVAGEVFDVIYADPPYAWERYDDLLMSIDRDLTLAPDALVALEHRRRTSPISIEPQRLRHVRRAEYGEVWISIFST